MASQSHQDKAREAARKATKPSDGGGGAKGRPVGHTAVSPDLSFAEVAKQLGGLVDNPELLDQLKPKTQESGPAGASKAKVDEPKDLQAALQQRRQLQAKRDKAQKDIEKREKSISEQQAALEAKQHQQQELDEHIEQYTAWVRRFETIDVTGASGVVGQLALVQQMLGEVGKELPGRPQASQKSRSSWHPFGSRLSMRTLRLLLPLLLLLLPRPARPWGRWRRRQHQPGPAGRHARSGRDRRVRGAEAKDAGCGRRKGQEAAAEMTRTTGTSPVLPRGQALCCPVTPSPW